MEVRINTNDPYIKAKMQNVHFLDVETSLIDAKVFRPGQQFIPAGQTTSYTKLLTVAGGTMYDLYTRGDKGIWSFSNHHDTMRFAQDPLDDTFVLERLWDILDKADVIVAHNASFDRGWILGRFVQLGWKMPSKFSVVCSYRGLTNYNFTSKKLDRLSRQLLGTSKIDTTVDLWMRCSLGDESAFEEMLAYNIGDIYDTLFKVYMRTCQYYPDYAVDLVNYALETPQCKVTGDLLEENGVWTSRKNGNQYNTYINPVLGIVYKDRYNIRSKKSGKGLVTHHR
jgi:hypothetical protein